MGGLATHRVSPNTRPLRKPRGMRGSGQRVQGFLRKLGIDHSYAIVNAYLYSVFGQPSHKEVLAVEPAVAPYRGKWLDALLVGSSVDAVVAFGDLAHAAFEAWRGPEN